MAESKVKKGFFFYLMIFLIIVVAFVGVCVVLMIFNPGKNVLGFKYYSNNATYEVKNSTINNSELNLGTTNFSEIDIDAGVANVSFEANSDYDKDAVVIVNKSKGFAKASENTGFSYSVNIENNKLIVKVTANKGIINFSNDINVIVHIARRESDVTVFKDTVLKVKTTSGNVNLGGNYKAGYSNNISLGGVDVETESGSITFTRNLNGAAISGREKYQYLKDIKLKTKSGTINLIGNSDTEVVKEGNSSTKIVNVLSVSSPATLDVELNSGKLKLGNANGNIKLFAKGATVEATSLKGDLDVSLNSTIFNVGTIDGDLDFAKGNVVMDNNKITVGKVTGIVNIPDGRSSIIKISEIGGESIIHTTSGEIVVGGVETALKKLSYIESESGNIEAYFDGSAVSRTVKTKKGKVTVNYVDKLTSGEKNEIINENGKTFVNFNKDSKIRFYFEKIEDSEEFDLSNVSFDILNGRSLSSNPYYYNITESTGASVYIKTNKTVVLDLI